MAVNPNDPAYKAEVVPASIKLLGQRLRAAYGVGPDNFGDRGNLAHTKGYHRSRRYNKAHAPGDYSIVLAADKQGDENWICAFDITPSVWGSADNRQKMISMTRRMRAAARARDPRVSALREFAGTENGRDVVTIDMQTGADREPFDDTHLDHGHGSLFRGRAADDHTGIYQVIVGLPPIPLKESNVLTGQDARMVHQIDATTFYGVLELNDAVRVPTSLAADGSEVWEDKPNELARTLRSIETKVGVTAELTPAQLQQVIDGVAAQLGTVFATKLGPVVAAVLEDAVGRLTFSTTIPQDGGISASGEGDGS